MTAIDVLFWAFSGLSIAAAWRVFEADSMVRAAYWLLTSFVGVGGVLVLVGGEFAGVVLILMMAGEMTIMALVMVMFMMNPAGLNPMTMVHQQRLAIAAGAGAFVLLGAAALLTTFPDRPSDVADATADLGVELLGPSMLVFQTAGVTLLATMVGAVALSSRRGRYGEADEGSREPNLAVPPENAVSR